MNDNKIKHSPAGYNLGAHFFGSPGLRPLALVFAITLGVKFLLLLVFIAILAHLSRLVSDDAAKPRDAYGMRSQLWQHPK